MTPSGGTPEQSAGASEQSTESASTANPRFRTDLPDEVRALYAAQNEIRNVMQSYGPWSTLVSSVRRLRDEFEKAQRELAELRAERAAIADALRKTCPLCKCEVQMQCVCGYTSGDGEARKELPKDEARVERSEGEGREEPGGELPLAAPRHGAATSVDASASVAKPRLPEVESVLDRQRIDPRNLFAVESLDDGGAYCKVVIRRPPGYGRTLSGREAANLAAWLLACADVTEAQKRDLLLEVEGSLR